MRRIQNPPNPYLKYSAEFLGEPPAARLEIFEEIAARRVITKSDVPEMGVRYNVFPFCKTELSKRSFKVLI